MLVCTNGVPLISGSAFRAVLRVLTALLLGALAGSMLPLPTDDVTTVMPEAGRTQRLLATGNVCDPWVGLPVGAAAAVVGAEAMESWRMGTRMDAWVGKVIASPTLETVLVVWCGHLLNGSVTELTALGCCRGLVERGGPPACIAEGLGDLDLDGATSGAIPVSSEKGSAVGSSRARPGLTLFKLLSREARFTSPDADAPSGIVEDDGGGAAAERDAEEGAARDGAAEPMLSRCSRQRS